MRQLNVALFALGACASLVAAQCPDGAPAFTCARRAGPPPIDSNRIAILPARTSGADRALDHLREGFVELMAPYFNGELGLQSVESGEALNAWNKAGIGVAPATPAQAVRVAAGLGAGQVAYSAVSGTATRFSVTTSILRVPGGGNLGPPLRVEGSPDSLAAFARRMSTRLFAQREQAMQARASDPGTTNDSAALAYITGMAAFRALRVTDAMSGFRQAIERDTNYVLAAYRLVVSYQLFGPSAAGSDATIWPRLWAQRGRLSGEQRQLLEALADANGPLFRMAALPRLERAIPLLQNSVEAHDILGSLYLKVGGLVGYKDWQARSKAAFRRAMALNPALAVNAKEGLVDIAFMEHDARAHASLVKAFPTPVGRYQAALLRRDPAAIRAARLEYVRDVLPRSRYAAPLNGMVGAWPPNELDSLLADAKQTATTDRMVTDVQWNAAFAAANAGRPAQAAEARWLFQKGDSAGVYLMAMLFAQDDSAAAEWMASFAATHDRFNLRGRPPFGAECDVSLSRLRRGDTTGAATVAARLRPAGGPGVAQAFAEARARVGRPAANAPRLPNALEVVCGQVLLGVLTAVNGAGSAELHRADSLMRAMPMNCCDYWNYDVALALARRGEYAAAASAVRRHWIQQSEPAPRLAIALVSEGRWAAKAADTASAVAAYRNYLMWRENPEPALVPQRDSARAELAAIERVWKPKGTARPAAKKPPTTRPPQTR